LNKNYPTYNDGFANPYKSGLENSMVLNSKVPSDISFKAPILK